MKVLITGGAGFIGSHLVDALIADGCDVTVIDDLSTGSMDNLSAAADNGCLNFVRANVRDESIMSPLVEACDSVFHLAAAVGVNLILAKPVDTIETNIHGSEVALGLAAKFKKKILLASTSEVYGKNSKVPFNEDDNTTLGPTSLSRWSYACTKLVDEFMAMAYRDQYGLQAVVCRLFNTIGPRQRGRYGMVVPRFVKRALKNEPIEIYGTGAQNRCFANVSDVVGAMIKLSRCPQALGKVVNVGADEPITIEDLAGKIVEMTGSKSEVKYLTYEQAYGKKFDDMLVRVPDMGRIGDLIGYKPEHSLQQTLDQVIEYYRATL